MNFAKIGFKNDLNNLGLLTECQRLLAFKPKKTTECFKIKEKSKLFQFINLV